MTGKTHESLVTDQFGPRAAAYVQSAVHAQGQDLQQLADMVRGHAAARVLDLGCGGGHASFTVAPHVREVVAYDLSAEMLAAVTQEAAGRGLGNLVTRQGGVENLPFENASFDFVLSRFSAHHWRDWKLALREARRVLKANGRGVFIDVVAPERPLFDTHMQAIELLRDPSHVRDYSPAEWKAALIQAGFVPGAMTMRRLRLEFSSWVERMRTPEIHVRAIRSLQTHVSQDVMRHFEIEGDGTFTLDVMTIEVT